MLHLLPNLFVELVVTLRAPAEFARPYARCKLSIFIALAEQRQTCMVEKMIDLILQDRKKKEREERIPFA